MNQLAQRLSEYLSDPLPTKQCGPPWQKGRKKGKEGVLETVVPMYISEVMFNIILKYMLESKTSYISSIACRLGSQLNLNLS